jgi:hypothetical protein
MPKLEIHYADDWAALYVDGELDPGTVGDSYHAEHRVFELLGVTQVHDDAFMRGQTQVAGVAKTLDEVGEYRRQRDTDRQEAARLKEEAAALLARAKELEG